MKLSRALSLLAFAGATVVRASSRDVAVTTDFRDVFAEVLAKRAGVADLRRVFPGYDCDEGKRLGLIA